MLVYGIFTSSGDERNETIYQSKKQYINLKNNKKYKVMTEIDNRDATEYVDVDSELYVTFDTKLPIPLIGNVAAGIPISVQVEFDQYIMLPKDWLIAEDNSFALTVTGDSMIGAGINKRDIVIVSK